MWNADRRSNSHNDKESRLTWNLAICTHLTTANKWLDTACWNLKIDLSCQRTTKASVRTVNFQTLAAFELHLTSAINRRTHKHMAMLLFWRDRVGKTVTDWLNTRYQPELALDGIRRTVCKDFNHIFGVITKTRVHTHLWKPCFGIRCI